MGICVGIRIRKEEMRLIYKTWFLRLLSNYFDYLPKLQTSVSLEVTNKWFTENQKKMFYFLIFLHIIPRLKFNFGIKFSQIIVVILKIYN